MHITRARTTKKHPYVMHDQQLEIVTETVAIGNRQDGSLYSANTDSTVLLKPKNVSREKKFYLLAILQILISW
jgi:hypothetical protein